MAARPAHPAGVVVDRSLGLVVPELLGRVSLAQTTMGLAQCVEAEAVLADPVKTPTTTNTMATNTTRRTVLVGRDCRFLLPATLLSTLLEVLSGLAQRLLLKTPVVAVEGVTDSQAATESLSSPTKGRRSPLSAPA